MDPSDAITPFRLIAYPSAGGGHGLILFEPAIDTGPAAAVLEARGFPANGYAWAGVARRVLDRLMPEACDRVTLDPSAGMFAARGADAAILSRLGAHMARLYHEPATLAELVAGGDAAEFD